MRIALSGSVRGQNKNKKEGAVRASVFCGLSGRQADGDCIFRIGRRKEEDERRSRGRCLWDSGRVGDLLSASAGGSEKINTKK